MNKIENENCNDLPDEFNPFPKGNTHSSTANGIKKSETIRFHGLTVFQNYHHREYNRQLTQ